MLTRVSITNYRSFRSAEVALSPFTLVIGANGAGKSNFLRFFADINTWNGSRFQLDDPHPRDSGKLMPHLNAQNEQTAFNMKRETDGDERIYSLDANGRLSSNPPFVGPPFDGHLIQVLRIDPGKVSSAEKIGSNQPVGSDGSGVAQMLDNLKTGDREDLFDAIEADLRQFLPEVKKLSLASRGEGKKAIQITEEGIDVPTPGTHLSDGTRTLLALLTIVHQPVPPPLLLIEDLDHSIHPRLFQELVGFLRELTESASNPIQIIATTHNPYLLDCFTENADSVLLVEKEHGSSKIRSLGPELRDLREKGAPLSMSLSKLYLNHFIGA